MSIVQGGLSDLSRVRLWKSNAGGHCKMIRLEKIVDRIIRGMVRSADKIIMPRRYTVVACARGGAGQSSATASVAPTWMSLWLSSTTAGADLQLTTHKQMAGTGMAKFRHEIPG